MHASELEYEVVRPDSNTAFCVVPLAEAVFWFRLGYVIFSRLKERKL